MKGHSQQIVAVKHNELRNGKRTAMYWSIESRRKSLFDSKKKEREICDHWFELKIPIRLKKILNNAKIDKRDSDCIKRGVFKITLKNPLVFDDFGHVKFANVENLEFIK